VELRDPPVADADADADADALQGLLRKTDERSTNSSYIEHSFTASVYIS
jgi:hypothetical protein